MCTFGVAFSFYCGNAFNWQLCPSRVFSPPTTVLYVTEALNLSSGSRKLPFDQTFSLYAS